MQRYGALGRNGGRRQNNAQCEFKISEDNLKVRLALDTLPLDRLLIKTAVTREEGKGRLIGRAPTDGWGMLNSENSRKPIIPLINQRF